MDINNLKYRITFLKPSGTSNQYSTNQNIVYTDYVTVWGRKQDIGGNKTIQNYELFCSQTLQFEIRYRTDIDETFRIKYNDKIYEISAPFKSTEYHNNLIITAELLQ